MTRDELIEIIEDNTSVNDGLDFENGFAFYKPYVDDVDKAADAILAKLEEEQRLLRQELYRLQQVGAA